MIEWIDRMGIELFFGSGSVFLDTFALNVTNALMWIPMYLALLLLVIKNHDNMQQILVCFGCGVFGVLLATGLTTAFTKPLLERLRPCNDPEFKYLVDIAGNLHNKDFSFFSSHAATSMSLAVFFALVVRDKVLTAALVAWSLLTCWTRMYLGQHFLTDIMVGLVWGSVVGLLAFLLYHKVCVKIMSSSRSISNKYTSTGFDYYDIDVVLSVIAITLLVATISWQSAFV